MHCPRVRDEIETRPWVAGEEVRRQQVALEPVASPAREYEVARHVWAAVRQRVHVIERREIEFLRLGAVHAAPAAVAHGGSLDRVFLAGRQNVPAPPRGDSGRTRKGHTVIMPIS